MDTIRKFKRKKLSKVLESNLTKQGREVRTAERAVWTDRMLQTLVTGVKGGVWFSLIDKVYSRPNLEVSYQKVRKNRGCSGVDHIGVEEFGSRLNEELTGLQEQLRNGSYQPQRILRVEIPKPGTTKKRPLGIPTVRDRVVQTALRSTVEPIFERQFHDHSYGFRPELGCKDALREVDRLLKSGYHWVVDIDIESYFDSIPHEELMQEVSKSIADKKVLSLIRQFLKQEIVADLKTWIPDQGSPQGAVISPLLSNIYLNPLDHSMAVKGYEMIRYADDAVVMCRSKEEAIRALEELTIWMTAHQLKLHPEKTRIAALQEGEGFDFLGYHFEKSRYKVDKINRWPRQKSMNKLRESIRLLTKRTSGESMPVIIKKVNPILRGWFNYFKHSKYYTFKEVDKWVRMRLRSILRKRMKKRGRGRGSDHHRWPNAYFREMGFFSMYEAFIALKQPPCG